MDTGWLECLINMTHTLKCTDCQMFCWLFCDVKEIEESKTVYAVIR